MSEHGPEIRIGRRWLLGLWPSLFRFEWKAEREYWDRYILGPFWLLRYRSSDEMTARAVQEPVVHAQTPETSSG